MEQPKMPMLTLDLQKTTTYNTVPLRLTQGDKGYIQPFTLTNAFQQYTVTADVLGFRAMKPDGKYIEIQNEPARFALADGVWEFNLPDELTQAIGTVTGAYFYVQSGTNIVASTTKFNYSISAAWSSDEESNNYATAFEKLMKKLQDMVSAGATTVNGLNNYSNEAKATLTKSLNDFTASVNTWKTTTTTAVDKVLADEKTALQKAQSDWNAEYNKVIAYYANMAVEWLAKKASYDKLAADEIAKMETALEKLVAEKNAAIAKIGTDSTAKLTDIQSDYDTFKNGIKTTLDGLLKDVPALESRVTALTTQLDDIDIVSVKAVADKATADVATLTKSMVKSATVNGGTKVLPDTAGNLALTIPNPDLSPYALDTDVTKKIESLSVGGRNYILDSTTPLKVTGNGDANQVIGNKYYSFGKMVNLKVKAGTVVSISYDVEVTGTSPAGYWKPQNNALPWEFQSDNQTKNIVDYIGKGKTRVYTAVRVTDGWRATTAVATGLQFRMDNVPSTISIIFNNLKFEIGNIATDWTPAPEDISADIDTKISKLTKSVNGVKPDASGNISLPQPDLSPYATTVAMNTAITSAKTAMATDAQTKANTALSSAKSYADTKKSEAQSYTDTKLSGVLKSWTGTQAQYDAMAIKDPNVLYIIKEVV